MKSAFSVDVEDWFHILDLDAGPLPADWDHLPSRVEAGFLRLLDLFEAHDARVTCFFLGWIADRFPGLVLEARARGHEIASHGYAHLLVHHQTPAEFVADATRTRELLEEITGDRVLGYRAAGFSVPREPDWYFKALTRAGYGYDASVFPGRRGGPAGDAEGTPGPYLVRHDEGTIAEFPVSVARVLGQRIFCFGGGYLRLFPYAVIRGLGRRVLAEGRPITFYVHPREIDADHPRLPMSPARRFRCYCNLHTTEAKLRRILQDFETTTFGDHLLGEGLVPAARAPRASRGGSPRDRRDA